MLVDGVGGFVGLSSPPPHETIPKMDRKIETFKINQGDHTLLMIENSTHLLLPNEFVAVA